MELSAAATHGRRGGRSRVAASLGLAVAVALTVTACGGGSGGASGNSGGDVTLTYGTNGTDAQLAAEQKVLDAFHKANPTITVKMQATPFDSYGTKLTTALRAHNGPDVFRVNHTDVQTYADAKFLASMDKAGIDTSALIPGLVSAGKVDGTQYTVPIDTDARALYYNMDVLAKAGITTPPATWDDLLADIAKVHSSTDAYGFAYRADGDYAMAYESVGPFMKTAGGAILSDDGGKVQASAGDDTHTADAVELLQSIVKTGATPPGQANMDEDTMDQLFAQDKLAFMLGGPWERATIEKDKSDFTYGKNWATATVPAETAGGVTASTSGGWQLGVAASSDHQAAAFKLVSFLEEPANAEAIAASGTFPALKDGLDAEPWKSDPFYDAFKTELPNSGLPILPVPQLAEVAAAFEKNVAPVVQSGSSAQTALKAFDSQVDDQILR